MPSEITSLIFPLKGMMCSPKAKLIIELDGSQQLEQEEYDVERTAFFESKGYQVLRFWNNQVMSDIKGVIKAIGYALETHGYGERSQSCRLPSPPSGGDRYSPDAGCVGGVFILG